MNAKTRRSKFAEHDRWKALKIEGIWNSGPKGAKTHYETILWALAHIAHACEIQSRELASSHNLSGLEFACLRRIVETNGETLEHMLAHSPLSERTLVEIYERLESRHLVTIFRDERGEKLVGIEPTEAGIAHAYSAPPPIHERFADALMQLPEDEQEAIATSFRRVVELIEEETANHDVSDA
jgi:DNA-binding MarR family transcriptional regulator